MQVKSFFNKVLLGAFFLPAFVTSSELNLLESDAEPQVQHALDVSAVCRNFNNGIEEAVFASYRNNGNQHVFAGSNVLFNIRNANKGRGIVYDSETGVFKARKAGFYQIIYGTASIGDAGLEMFAFGFNVIRTRGCERTLVDSFLANSSSAIILFLRECDEISIVSQESVNLAAGSLPPLTTTLTDTAYISFVRLNR